MSDTTTQPTARFEGWGIPALLAGLKILIHLPVLTLYGIHHDELYFLACGRHLAAGYVDHAPLVPFLARLADELFGGALPALRLPAVLAGAATIALTARLARRLGAGPFGQTLAGLAVLTAPFYLRVGNLLHLPTFEPLFWTAAIFLVVRILQGESPRLWLAVGAVGGLGLLNKHTMLLFGAALVLALASGPGRSQLRSPWLWAGGALAALLFLPNLLWQAAHGWPTLTFLSNLRHDVLDEISPLQFIVGQFLYQGPISAPLWLAGLVSCFRAGDVRLRWVGRLYLVCFALLLLASGKIYYLAPIYPTLFALGGLWWEGWLEKLRRPVLRPATVGALLLGNGLLAPLSLPILPIESTVRYVDTVTFGALGNVYELTGDLRGMFGWKERAEAVARVYQSLSPEERATAPILTSWYGPAGAIDFFGRPYGLPPATSGHMTYHLWGPPPQDFDVAIAADLPTDLLEELFEEVVVVENPVFEQSNPGDRYFPVAICRHPKVDLREVWPQFRNWGF